MLTRDEIKAAEAAVPDLTPCAVPAWGGEVNIRSLSALELVRLSGERVDEDATKDERDRAYCEYSARLLVASVCDAEGLCLFSEKDVPWLVEKCRGNVFAALVAEVRRRNNDAPEQSEGRLKN